MSDNALVDLSCLEEYTNGDPEGLKELITVFFETAEESLNELQSNIVDGQNMNWSDAGHKLKGAAAYVGAEKLKSFCAQAQDMKTADRQARLEMYEKIKAQYDDVILVLEEQLS